MTPLGEAMNPRPHAEVIKAWADGEQIQYRAPGNDAWVDCPDPAWTVDYEYRVKPGREYPESMMSEKEISKVFHGHMKDRIRAVANAVLRHAIDNGQVVTR